MIQLTYYSGEAANLMIPPTINYHTFLADSRVALQVVGGGRRRVIVSHGVHDRPPVTVLMGPNVLEAGNGPGRWWVPPLRTTVAGRHIKLVQAWITLIIPWLRNHYFNGFSLFYCYLVGSIYCPFWREEILRGNPKSTKI